MTTLLACMRPLTTRMRLHRHASANQEALPATDERMATREEIDNLRSMYALQKD